MAYKKRSNRRRSNKRSSKRQMRGGVTGMPENWYSGKAPALGSNNASNAGKFGRDLNVGPNNSGLVGGKKVKRRSIKRRSTKKSAKKSSKKKTKRRSPKKGGRSKINTPGSLSGHKRTLNTGLSKLGARVSASQEGGSDWGFSQYSAGPINTPPQSEAQFRMFNKTTPYSVGSQSLTSADIDSVLCNKPVKGWSVGDSLIDSSAESYASVGGKKKRRSSKKSPRKSPKKSPKRTKKRSVKKSKKRSVRKSAKGGKKHHRSTSRKHRSTKKSKKRSKKGGNVQALTALGLLGLHEVSKRSPRRSTKRSKKRSTRRRRR